MKGCIAEQMRFALNVAVDIMQIYIKRSKVAAVSFVEKNSCEHAEQL